MIFNLAVAAMVLGLAYAWMVRGFFSAFIHTLCVLMAGALAFATWEPIAYMLLGAAPERGLLSFVSSAAWGIALALPFAVYLLVLRLITDKVINGNVKNATAADYAGGAVCGLATGVITAGITVLSIQALRVPSDFLGYQPVWYAKDTGQGGGSLVKNDTLWIPADRITAGVYSALSMGSLSSSHPLATWHPDLVASGLGARLSPGGAGKNTIRPDDLRIVGTYAVGSESDLRPANDLLSFAGSSTAQKYLDIDGDPVAQGYLAGYIFEFEPAAKETSGKGGKGGAQMIVSNGQISLVAQDTDTGKTTTVYPIAMVSESGDTENPGSLGRWRFDGRDVFISSVGGQSNVKMGFEFLVPAGHTPLAINFRQCRVELGDNLPKPVVLKDAGDRDLRIRSGAIFRAGTDAKRTRDTEFAVTYDPTGGDARTDGVAATTRIGEIIPSQSARGKFTLDDANRIVTGEGKFAPEEIKSKGGAAGKNLRVDSYFIGADQALVQIDVSLDKPISLLNEAARNAPTDRPIVLVDKNGNEYDAIGFTYRDRELFHVRFTPGSTLSGMTELPSISSARGDQKLVILFVVTKGAQIEQLAIGDTVIATFRPFLDAK